MKINAFLLVALMVVVHFPFSMVFATEITTSVSQNPVSLDESFEINFTAHSNPDGNPDFSPLEQDFTIIHHNHTSNLSWTNGNASKILQWQVAVRAKKTGNLTIPVISFGSDRSAVMSVLVTASTDYSNPHDEDLFMEAEASPISPFVQSQVLYTLRVATRVEIARGELQEPELADAVIEKLGNDSNYSKQINGVDYSVTERHYAIFPQKSGKVTIKPLELKAEILTNNAYGMNSFFNSQLTKTKRVYANAIDLNVQPVPTSFTGSHWLSAQDVQIKQQWSSDIGQLKVGEPLTRTLTLTAKGATVGQLPELNYNSSNSRLKTYFDQPILQEKKLPEGILSIREEKIALIPPKPGEYTLPAINIPWFNTATNRMEIATIPELKLYASGEVLLKSDTPEQQPTPKKPLVPANEQISKPMHLPTVAPDAQFWPWLCGFLAIAWFVTLLFFITQKSPPKKEPSTDIKNLPLKIILKSLKQACANNDACGAKNILLDWGNHQYECNNLGELAGFCDARLRDEILLLNQAIYRQKAEPWQGKKLFQTFIENSARAKLADQEDKSLEPLHRL